MMQQMTQGGLVNRMIRAAKLDRSLYREVAADPTLNGEATLAVVIASVLSAIGSFLGIIILGSAISFGTTAVLGLSMGYAVISGLIIGPIVSVLSWLLWALVSWFVGTRVMAAMDSSTPAGTGVPVGAPITFWSVARALGYAQGPNALGILGFIPVLGLLVRFVIWIWVLLTGFVAIRESMRLSDGQTIAVVVIGFLAYIVVSFVVYGILIAGALATIF